MARTSGRRAGPEERSLSNEPDSSAMADIDGHEPDGPGHDQHGPEHDEPGHGNEPAGKQDAAGEPDTAADEPDRPAEVDGDAAADESHGSNTTDSTGDAPEQIPEPERTVGAVHGQRQMGPGVLSERKEAQGKPHGLPTPFPMELHKRCSIGIDPQGRGITATENK
eukprot:4545452-Heterocapsa_arctica.AAC.1